VEGPEGNQVHNNQMEVDEGNSGTCNSGEGHREESRDVDPRVDNANNGNKDNPNNELQYNASQDNKQSEAVHGIEHVQVGGHLGNGQREANNQPSSLQEYKQTEAVHAGHVYVEATRSPQAEQNTPTKSSFQINEEIFVQGDVDSDLDCTIDDVNDTIPMAKISNSEFQHGNFFMNLNWSLNESKNARYKYDSIVHNQLHPAV
jgi:hypothetical protein